MSWQSFQKYIFDKLSSVRQAPTPITSTAEGLKRISLSEYCLQDLDVPIFSLPEELLLNILSYLPADDLVKCSEVCKLWERVSSDRILWEHTLRQESLKWSTVASGAHWKGHFDDDDDTEPQLHPKTTYLRCSFEAKPFTPSFLQNLASVWRSLISRKKPKFIMVGPGIDSKRTSRVVGRMVNDKCVEFEPVDMLPGIAGFGTGLTFKLNLNNESHLFDLATLYSTRQQDRGSELDQNKRVRGSFLFNQLSNNEGLESLTVTNQFRSFCDTVDGVVFVIDAENNPDEISNCTRHELKAIIKAFSSGAPAPRHVPILIFSLIKTKEPNTRKISAFHVSQKLDLFSYSNKWCVQDSSVQDMSGISHGFLWLIQKWVTS